MYAESNVTSCIFNGPDQYPSVGYIIYFFLSAYIWCLRSILSLSLLYTLNCQRGYYSAKIKSAKTFLTVILRQFIPSKYTHYMYMVVSLRTCSSCDQVLFSLREGRSHMERRPDTSRVARRWPPGLTLIQNTTPYKMMCTFHNNNTCIHSGHGLTISCTCMCRQKDYNNDCFISIIKLVHRGT